MRILYVGRFDIRTLFLKWDQGAAPSNHVHAVPLLSRQGFEVKTLAWDERWKSDPRAFEHAVLDAAEDADAVLGHSYHDLRRCALMRRTGRLKVPLCSFVHSTRGRLWEGPLFKAFDLLLPLNFVTLERLARRGMPADRLAYFPFGADLDYVDAQVAAVSPVSPSTRPSVLSVGVTGRDFRTLIAAAPDIDAQIDIVGRVPEADRAGLPANVTVHSGGNYDMPFSAIAELYLRASCVVVTHHGSETPYGLNAIVEAMAFGKAVVQSRGPGIDINPLTLGFGDECEIHQPADMAARINALLADAPRRQQFGAKARACAEAVYNDDVMAAGLAQALRRRR